MELVPGQFIWIEPFIVYKIFISDVCCNFNCDVKNSLVMIERRLSDEAKRNLFHAGRH
jgi:hypothetical protein